jgi:hypothetical protein
MVVLLVGLIALAGFPPGVRERLAKPADASVAPRASGETANRQSAPPTPRDPLSWARIEIRGYGRGATVENVWALGDRFVAEIESDEGPDGGPYGPVSSVLVTSTDGLAWTNVALPAADFVVEAGTVVDGRLWVVGYAGPADAALWQLWSTDIGTWRHESDPVGLVDGPARVTDLAYRGRCTTEEDCRAVGWVAAVARVSSDVHDLHVSDDGRAWTAVDLGDERAMWIVGIAHARGRWIVAGVQRPSGSDRGATVALVSRDRVAWSANVVSTVEHGGRDLTSGVAGLALVGTERVGERLLPRAWLSSDGAAWLQVDADAVPGRTATAMDHVTRTEDGYFAMSSSTGDAWVSTDGALWRNVPVFVAGPTDVVRAIAAAGDVLLAAGRSTAGRPTFWSASLSVQLGQR